MGDGQLACLMHHWTPDAYDALLVPLGQEQRPRAASINLEPSWPCDSPRTCLSLRLCRVSWRRSRSFLASMPASRRSSPASGLTSNRSLGPSPAATRATMWSRAWHATAPSRRCCCPSRRTVRTAASASRAWMGTARPKLRQQQRQQELLLGAISLGKRSSRAARQWGTRSLLARGHVWSHHQQLLSSSSSSSHRCSQRTRHAPRPASRQAQVTGNAPRASHLHSLAGVASLRRHGRPCPGWRARTCQARCCR